MICPNCKAEYRPGFTRCADCLVPLVDALPEPELGTSKRHKSSKEPLGRLELVTVLRAGDAGLAMLAESLLQSADIPFTTAGGISHTVAGWSGLQGEGSPVEIMVNRVDAERARSLLGDLDAYVRQADTAADDPEDS
jgi:hypothetical protein